MSKHCPTCGSTAATSNGTRQNVSGILYRKYICKGCGKNYSVRSLDKFQSTGALNGEKFVITAAVNDVAVNRDFFDSLLMYCDKHDAKLIVLPVTYMINEVETPTWDEILHPYMISMSLTVVDGLRILGNISISPTIENPIAGLDYLSKGDSLIIGHTQLQMKTLAVNAKDNAAMITTTGVVTMPDYSVTKQGEKARFNHSFSALVVEKDDTKFHLRVLNADETGSFYDIDGYYTVNGIRPIEYIEALITGDEHAIFVCPDVKAATYTDEDSIVNVLKPKRIVRHDVLDCYSVSHHHRNNFFTRYGKFKSNTHKIEDELKTTLKFIQETTPAGVENIIVSSNHNDHLYKWLNESDPKFEPWNAKIYHELMYLMLDSMKVTGNSFEFQNPFELWVKQQKSKNKSIINFIGRDDSYKICEIEISNHGDAGVNGSRGSILQYSRLAYKSVIGHSHSPGISKGSYQVGTSSQLKLEYVQGPSSWLNAHCVIYPNGKRQLLFIIGGKWKK